MEPEGERAVSRRSSRSREVSPAKAAKPSVGRRRLPPSPLATHDAGAVDVRRARSAHLALPCGFENIDTLAACDESDLAPAMMVMHPSPSLRRPRRRRQRLRRRWQPRSAAASTD